MNLVPEGRLVFKKLLYTFPVRALNSSFFIVKSKRNLLRMDSDMAYRYLTNDDYNGRVIPEEIIAAGFRDWKIVSEEFPEKFRIKISGHRVRMGIFGDEGTLVECDEAIVTRIGLNYQLSINMGNIIFPVSYDKLLYKIHIGEWVPIYKQLTLF